MFNKVIPFLFLLVLLTGLISLIKLFLFPNASGVTMIKNLKNQAYSSRFEVNQNIQFLLSEAKDDEYRLGMVLYASAIQGDEKIYSQSLLKMKQKLDKLSLSYQTWRLGRILLAADCMNDLLTKKRTLADLKVLLANPNITKDAFSAWALGYLAALNNDEYKTYKNEMLAAAQALTEQYGHAKINHDDSNNTQAKLSDALWAWVMAIQAAANAQDNITFNFILDQIKIITTQKTISDALSQELKRLSDSNDYPAWAMSIVQLSAATIGNQSIFDELEKPLHVSIQGAKETIKSSDEKNSYSARAEATLAELNSVLSVIRINEKCRLKKSTTCLVSRL